MSRPVLYGLVVAAAALLLGALAGGCRHRGETERTEGAARRTARGSTLSAELAAALPVLERAERHGCDPPPEGLPPQLRVDAGCRAQIAVVVRGDPAALEARIAGVGGLVTRRAGDPPTLQAWAPPALLRMLAEDPDVAAVRLPLYARPLDAEGPGSP